MGHNHVTYPTTLPLDCVVNAARILRSGEIAENAAELGADVYAVIGYLLNTIVGPPSAGQAFGSASAAAVQNHLAKEREKVANSAELKDLAEAVSEAIGKQSTGQFGAATSNASAPQGDGRWVNLFMTLLPLLLQLLAQSNVIKTN